MVSFLLILACTTPPESATPIPDGVPPGAEVGPPGGPPGGEAAGNQPGQPTVPGDGTATAQPTHKAWTTYGAEVAINEAIPVGQVLDAPQDFLGQQVVVEGRVADVCQKKGCWMVVADGDRTMRIRMKDYGFTVDMAGTGGDCQVQGTVTQKEVDGETVAHLASESQDKDAMPEPEGGGTTFEIEATGVRMRGAGG